MTYTDTRIAKLRTYLFNIIDSLVTNSKYQVNADFLGKVGDYSLDKVPTASKIEEWIIGGELHKEVFDFRSRKSYSADTINNLTNIGFFEDFEKAIKTNNKEGILPDINGIESIECLNCGALNSVDGTEAIYNIQIQITYREINDEGGVISL